MRMVVSYIGHTSLLQTYEDHNKIVYAHRKLGIGFPKNDKGLYKMINKMSDKDAKFLKEHWRYSRDALDEKKWGR